MFPQNCKTIRHELETCNGDYKDVERRNVHKWLFDCIHTAEFLEDLQDVLKNPGIGIRALSREMNVSFSSMPALNENRLTKAKKLLRKVKHPAAPQIIWFFSNEKNLYITRRMTDVVYTFQRNNTEYISTNCDGFRMCVLWGWRDASAFFQREPQVELRWLCAVAKHCSQARIKRVENVKPYVR